jgi:glycosyltransferase involved in cell wall biosynthesis
VRGTGGGPEKTIMLGAARADRGRTDVTVCYLRDARDAIYRLDERAAQLGIAYVEVVERHSFDVGIWRQLVRLVRERHIDIVHAHDYKTDALTLMLARATGIVPLATAHGWTGQSAAELRLYYPIDKRMLARFPRVIAVSSEIRDEIVRRGLPAERAVVILNGIDPAAFRRTADGRPPARAALGYADDQIVIGAVGRLERQKRFDLLIEAFAPLAAGNPRLRLAIVGEGSLRSALEQCAESAGVMASCRLLGHRDDIVALHHAFDLFVQSSEYEGTPNAVLEAMAMETPIVATDVGGTRELAHNDEHALIVPPHDVGALGRAMAAAIDDPVSARRRAEAARRRVEDELSFDARTRRLERLYEELASERRTADA